MRSLTSGRCPPPALELRGLTKRYDDGFLALDGFDLTVGDGEFFGLLGPNGAGKTTLISAVCNLIRVTAGEALRLRAPARLRSRRAGWSGSPSRTSTSTASSTSRRRCSTTAATTGWSARTPAAAPAR